MNDDNNIRSKANVCIGAMLELLKSSDDENQRLRREVEVLREEIQDLSSEVARLWKRIGENFDSSGTPPGCEYGGTPPDNVRMVRLHDRGPGKMFIPDDLESAE